VKIKSSLLRLILAITLALGFKVASAQSAVTLNVIDERKQPIPYYTIKHNNRYIVGDSVGKAFIDAAMIGKSISIHTVYGDSTVTISKNAKIIFRTELNLEEIKVYPSFKLSTERKLIIRENIFKSVDYAFLTNSPTEFAKGYSFVKKVRIKQFSIKALKKEASTQKPILHLYLVDSLGQKVPIRVEQFAGLKPQIEPKTLKFNFRDVNIILQPGKYFFSVEFLPISNSTRTVKSYWVTLTPSITANTAVKNLSGWQTQLHEGYQMDLVSELIYQDVL